MVRTPGHSLRSISFPVFIICLLQLTKVYVVGLNVVSNRTFLTPVKHDVNVTLQVEVSEAVEIGFEVYNLRDSVPEDVLSLTIADGDQYDRFAIRDDLTVYVKKLLDYDISPKYQLLFQISQERSELIPFTCILHIQVNDNNTWPPIYNDTCKTPIWRGVWPKNQRLFEPTINNVPVSAEISSMAMDTYNSECTIKFAAAFRNTEEKPELKDISFKCSDMEGETIVDVAVYLMDDYSGGPPYDPSWNDGFQNDVLIGTLRNFNTAVPQKWLCDYYVLDIKRQSLTIEPQLKGCPADKYGYYCNLDCACQNGATCHGFNGACKCSPGWQGPACDIPMPQVRIVVNSPILQLPMYSATNLTCRSYHVRKPYAYWYLNGSSVDVRISSNVVNIRKDDGTSTLVILRLTSDLVGSYQCIPEDEYGKTFESNLVEVWISGCVKGHWGDTCERTCDCEHARSCDQHVGCVCMTGWKGVHCDVKEEQKAGNKEDTLSIVGSTLAMVVLMCLIVTVIYIRRRRKPYTQLIVQSRNNTEHYDAANMMMESVRESGIRMISEDCLKPKELIGFGDIAMVFKAELVNENGTTIVAAKGLHPDHESYNNNRNICHEIEILGLLGNHDNIVNLIGVVVGQDARFLVEELMSENVLGFMNRHRHHNMDKNTDLMLVQFGKQIADAMNHLENKKVVHRDIAARNVLISANSVAKLGDFGLSRNVYCREVYVRLPGREDRVPARWMALESLTDGIYTFKTDIWSFGILLWELSTLGGFPYSELGSSEHLIRSLRGGYRMPPPLKVSDHMYTLMLSCWDRCPRRRPDARKLGRTLESFYDQRKGFFRDGRDVQEV
ncbi:fibroblast growth factor receptor 2-like [Ptychodera flava]|uniref:fibroblast growth factor receptor 2-like n=1 Tax=Ptychodera flava TaxID=63121 RepID=UPI00396A6971